MNNTEPPKKKKKFNIFDYYNFNRRDAQKDDLGNVLEHPDLKTFFKLFGRKFYQLISVNLFILLGNFPIFFVLFALSHYTSIASTAPISQLFPVLHGVSRFTDSPVLESLKGIFGLEAMITVPSTLTYVMYGLGLLLLVTFGIVNVGVTYIIRNMIKGEPVFLWTDFWYIVKRNLRQAILFGALDLIFCGLLIWNLYFYLTGFNAGMQYQIFFFMIVVMAILYSFVRNYAYTLLLTFDYKISQILKNSLIFAMLGAKRNIAAGIGCLLVILLNVGIFILYVPLGLILPFVITPAVLMFIGIYGSFPIIHRYLIAPIEAEQAAKEADEELEGADGFDE